MDAELPPARFGRRALLRLGLGLTTASLVACAPSPVIAPGTPRPVGASPAPALIEAAQLEVDAGLAWRTLGSLAPALADYAAAMTAMHVAHATVLLQPDPLGGVNTDHTPAVELTPAAPGAAASVAEANATIAGIEGSLASLASAQIKAGDHLALLWTSLAISAATTQGLAAYNPDGVVGPAPVPGDVTPFRRSQLEPNAALAGALAREEQLFDVLRFAIGRLAADLPLRRVLDARLPVVQTRIETLQEALSAASATPSPPPLGANYPADSPAALAEAAAALEADAANAWAQVAASAATPAEALTAAVDHESSARSLGGTPIWWPGWN